MAVANNANFGTPVALIDEFTRLNTAESLDALDKNNIYIYRLCSKAYVPFDITESVQLLETRNGVTGEVISVHNTPETAECKD